MVIILIARTQTGELVNLASASAKRRIAILKQQHRFFCPGCGSALILKDGDVKIPHFAHLSLAGCDTSSEPETPLHLSGKTLLHQFFSAKNHHAELEKFFPSIKQRADVLVEKKFALEYQCSSISPGLIRTRSEGYSSIGLTALWIRGISEAPKEGIADMRFRAFELAMLQQTGGHQYLIDYHPESNLFFYRSALFFARGAIWIAKTKALPADKQGFPFGVPKKLSAAEFAEVAAIASNERARFIHRQHFAKNRYRNPYWLLCYELGLDRSRLPLYIGVPIRGAEAFGVDAVVWQLQALADQAKGQMLPPADASPAENARKRLVSDYLEFVAKVKGRRHTQDEALELLYAIYCKTV
ncbi:competence protein CoiA [Planococcus sp. FY231025]|uniref:competence protein CoiA n=1 Tax=Planococcus sp. FY231025 TaxID=3455699 RepID=UPI003F8D9B27